MTIYLRPFTLADLPALVKYGDNPNIAANLTDTFPHPYTEESGRRFINHIANDTSKLIRAVIYDDACIGAIGLHPQTDIWQKNAELGYWLAEPFWGKGIMTLAVQKMTVYGFEKLRIDRIFARPFGSNTGSQKVLEKAGFSLEARLPKTIFKDGKYEDELIYGLRRDTLLPS